MSGRRASALVACLLPALALGCGDESSDEPTIPGRPDTAHVREVDRNPYKVTCADLRRQPDHPEAQKLVIRAEFSLARVPELRAQRLRWTLNRTGRSVYYALTALCKGKPGSFEPGRGAVAAVRAGKFRAAKNRPG
ncbi:MAG TPA: hypothetical protein VK307_00285 [Thermoleophilaceae bacterium]|nr:hypothetical protein [Thermoleophilaceae bacterium]